VDKWVAVRNLGFYGRSSVDSAFLCGLAVVITLFRLTLIPLHFDTKLSVVWPIIY
jgi:hypothetical protein